MNITYLHQYFNTPDMVGGTRSYELAKRLVSKGHTVNMITSYREESEKKDWFITNESGINVHWIPVPYSNNMGFKKRIKAFIKFAFKSAKKASSLKSDVIFASSTPLTIALPAIYASRKLRIPMVFEVRDLWPDVPIAMHAITSPLLKFASRKLEKIAYLKAKKIITLTPTMRDFISGKGVPLEKIHVVSNGASIQEYKALTEKKSNEPYTIIYCGKLGPAHGVEYLCMLAESAFKKSYPMHFKIAGDGKNKKELENTAKLHGTLGKTISFIGEVEKSKVFNLYANSDASIMTITDCEILYRHSVQNKFFDSIMAGRPVFANYSGWASELAEQKEIGCILPRHDYNLATEIIWKKLNSKNWMINASKKARELALSNFSYDILADKLEKVLIESI